MITFHCPHCEKELKSPPEYAGRKIKCKGCHQPTRIPDVPSAVAPATGDSELDDVATGAEQDSVGGVEALGGGAGGAGFSGASPKRTGMFTGLEAGTASRLVVPARDDDDDDFDEASEEDAGPVKLDVTYAELASRRPRTTGDTAAFYRKVTLLVVLGLIVVAIAGKLGLDYVRSQGVDSGAVKVVEPDASGESVEPTSP